MPGKLDYTSRALRFTRRFPIYSYLLSQITLWSIANILLAIITHLQTLSISQITALPITPRLFPMILVAIIMGTIYGTVLGLTDIFFDRQSFRQRSLGKIILVKTIISFTLLVILFWIIRFIIAELAPINAIYKNNDGLNEKAWSYLFYQFIVYYLVVTIIITFINQVNKKYGPGVLIPILMGKYRNPVEEERVFLFMDLRSSTSIGEKLGHFKYSSFIRDAFLDINKLVSEYFAEIYQYVGDEIVISWNLHDQLRLVSCVDFFFACEQKFCEREQYYLAAYGQVPSFKAGIHIGKVSAVEIGDIKRDIAYHGDTLNTTSRIQSKCNDFEKNLLASSLFATRAALNKFYKTENLGSILLKGKSLPVSIESITKK